MKYLVLLFSLLTIGSVKAQSIDFTLNAPDTTIYMARYFGSKLYYADTTQMNKGKFSFDGSKHQAGLYAILLPNGKPFDFIIDGEDKVEINIKDLDNAIPSTVVSKSENNKIFFDYMNYMAKKRKEGQGIAADMKKVQGDKEKEAYKERLKAINEDVKNYQKDIFKNHREKFIGVMVGISLEIDLPDYPRDEEGNITDSSYVYVYYQQHYWDNVDLKDPRIVNTPVFHNKLDRYFSKKGVIQIPDTICFYAKRMIDQTNIEDQSNKVFQYIVHHVTNKYEASHIMGMDKVFWYMATNYYCPPNKLAYWMDDESTEKVCERARKVGQTVIGGQSIPLILPDSTEEKWIGTYDLDAEYTVLYFWDPNCGHCKKVTPKLQTLYDKKFKPRNVEIYAVGKAMGEEFEKWKKFIRDNELTYINVGLTESVYQQAKTDPTPLLRNKTNIESLNYSDTYDVYSTPRIFILDKNKVIMYKQISIGQLEEIIDKLTGHESDEKLFPVEDPENGPGEVDH